MRMRSRVAWRSRGGGVKPPLLLEWGACREERTLQQVLLVTGGSRGIGAATAKLAARRGYAVAVNYTTRGDAADDVVREIEAGGGRAIAIQGDVAKETDILAMFEAV